MCEAKLGRMLRPGVLRVRKSKCGRLRRRWYPPEASTQSSNESRCLSVNDGIKKGCWDLGLPRATVRKNGYSRLDGDRPYRRRSSVSSSRICVNS